MAINNPLSLGDEVLPVAEYDHDQGYANIIGGHVYRGTAIPELIGSYVCGDYGLSLASLELYFSINLAEMTQ